MNVVAEILSGVLRGSKHLPFEQQQELVCLSFCILLCCIVERRRSEMSPPFLWAWIQFASCQDLLRFFVSKSSYMTTTFWSMCVYVCTMDRDPRRVRWMFGKDGFCAEDFHSDMRILPSPSCACADAVGTDVLH